MIPGMNKHCIAIGLLVAGSLLMAPAPAQNLGFLKNSPVAELTEDDEKLLQAAFNQALEKAADQETVTWENPDTGHNGSITILDTHEDFDTTCRTVRTATLAAGREGGGRYRLCKAEDGSWRFAPLRRAPSN